MIEETLPVNPSWSWQSLQKGMQEGSDQIPEPAFTWNSKPSAVRRSCSLQTGMGTWMANPHQSGAWIHMRHCVMENVRFVCEAIPLADETELERWKRDCAVYWTIARTHDELEKEKGRTIAFPDLSLHWKPLRVTSGEAVCEKLSIFCEMPLLDLNLKWEKIAYDRKEHAFYLCDDPVKKIYAAHRLVLSGKTALAGLKK